LTVKIKSKLSFRSPLFELFRVFSKQNTFLAIFSSHQWILNFHILAFLIQNLPTQAFSVSSLLAKRLELSHAAFYLSWSLWCYEAEEDETWPLKSSLGNLEEYNKFTTPVSHKLWTILFQRSPLFKREF